MGFKVIQAAGGDQPQEQAAGGFRVLRPAATKAGPVKRSLTQDITGFMANVNRGLGIGDELAGLASTGVNAVTGRGPQGLKANMAHQRAIEDEYRRDQRLASALALGTGNAATMAFPVGPGAAAFATGGRAINAVRGATMAGLTGAGYAAADRGDASERLAAALRTVRDPLTLGLGAIAGGMAARSKPKVERAEAPSLDELRQGRDEAYRAVDASGERFSADDTSQLLRDMAQAADDAGFHAGLHPKTAAMFERLGQSERAGNGFTPTLRELDQLRQQIGRDVAGANDPGERRMGQIMRDRIDAFIEGNGASDDILRARDLNTRVRKLEVLDGLDEAAAERAAATNSGGNINNATRQNVIRFKDKTKNLTAAERAAAEKVIKGTPLGNATRLVGKLSPEGNGLMTALHLLGAVPSHGVSVGAAGAGMVAKRVSDAITRRNINELRALIAAGGDIGMEVRQQIAMLSPADELRRQLANDLSAAAGVQGAAARAPIEIDVSRSTNPEHLAWRAANGRR